MNRRDDWKVTNPTVRDTVILVDEHGVAIGRAPKLAAHASPGQLHLAISVFLYRDDGALLLQQRAATKYHFPGLWANACCSHPVPGEAVADAAAARVREELGIDAPLALAGSLTYRAACPTSGLVEHEFDWVFVGEIDSTVHPDPREIDAVRFVTIDELGDGDFDGVLAPWFFPALELAEMARSASTSP
jgi:isopentenyl-diphosphate delta-isomerase